MRQENLNRPVTMKKSMIIALFLLAPLSIFAQQNTTAVQWLIKQPDLQTASISLMVKNLSTGQIIAQFNPQKALTPASTQKLITTAAALAILGDTVFKTFLQYDGFIKDSVLYGNLYIYGQADPTLGSENFPNSNFWKQWTQAVKKLGIKIVTGKIIADHSYFDLYPTPLKWTWEDLGNYYGAAPTAISIYDNSYKIFFKTGQYPGAPTKILKIEPQIPKLKIINHVRSANISSDQSYIIGAPYSFERLAIGALPYKRDSFVVKGAVPDPPLLAAQLFKQKLQEAGIIVLGEPTTVRTEKKIKPLANRHTFYIHYSPPLRQIIKVTNYYSVNLYAEILLLHLAKHVYKSGQNWYGIQAINSFLDTIGINPRSIFIYDGSGLSKYNAISAQALVRLLEYMYKSPYRQTFINSLPKAGCCGTLKYFGRKTILHNKVIAKSGSMRNVRAYAGYMINAKQDTLAFAIILNNFTCSQTKARKYIENFLIKLYQ